MFPRVFANNIPHAVCPLVSSRCFIKSAFWRAAGETEEPARYSPLTNDSPRLTPAL